MAGWVNVRSDDRACIRCGASSRKRHGNRHAKPEGLRVPVRPNLRKFLVKCSTSGGFFVNFYTLFFSTTSSVLLRKVSSSNLCKETFVPARGTKLPFLSDFSGLAHGLWTAPWRWPCRTGVPPRALVSRRFLDSPLGEQGRCTVLRVLVFVLGRDGVCVHSVYCHCLPQSSLSKVV